LVSTRLTHRLILYLLALDSVLDSKLSYPLFLQAPIFKLCELETI